MARQVLRRRALVLTLAMVVIAGAGTVGWAVWRGHEANVLLDEARARLGASLVEAPELDRIQASGAVSRLERAWPEVQAALVPLEPQTPHVLATGSGHYVQRQDPDLTIATIRLILGRVRAAR